MRPGTSLTRAVRWRLGRRAATPASTPPHEALDAALDPPGPDDVERIVSETLSADQIRTLCPGPTRDQQNAMRLSHSTVAFCWTGMRRSGRWVAWGGMDIRLIRRPHPNRMVRGSGITPTDP